jgi:hypothetical protein
MYYWLQVDPLAGIHRGQPGADVMVCATNAACAGCERQYLGNVQCLFRLVTASTCTLTRKNMLSTFRATIRPSTLLARNVAGVSMGVRSKHTLPELPYAYDVSAYAFLLP